MQSPPVLVPEFSAACAIGPKLNLRTDLRTKFIVRLASQNPMVTKVYRKGVYKWGRRKNEKSGDEGAFSSGRGEFANVGRSFAVYWLPRYEKCCRKAYALRAIASLELADGVSKAPFVGHTQVSP